jgi:hypothetical protein
LLGQAVREYTLAIAREEGVSVTARGGGTSQSGQTVNSTLVVDCSKYLDRVIDLDVPGKRCVVEPGIVLRAQPGAQAARALVPGRHLHRLARHHRLAQSLGVSSVVLIKNHGITFVRSAIEEATFHGLFIEPAGRMQIEIAATAWAWSAPDNA